MKTDNNTGKNKNFFARAKEKFDAIPPFARPVRMSKDEIQSGGSRRMTEQPTSAEYARGYAEGFNDACNPEQDKLLQIIAATYQIAGAYDAPAHVLDVLANPEGATQAQIDALLPFVRPQQEQLIGCVNHDCQRCKEMQDWEAVAADQALTIALLRSEQDPMATKDAERFAWWFSEDDTKHEFLTTYMEGVRNKWTIANWRAAIDAAHGIGEKT